MSKLDLFVVSIPSHKVVLADHPGRKIICADSFKKDCKVDNKRFFNDSYGNDNIAHLNYFYCELSAQYWVWKNYFSNYTYIGFEQYRRHFCIDKTKNTAPINYLENILKNYDFIVLKK